MGRFTPWAACGRAVAPPEVICSRLRPAERERRVALTLLIDGDRHVGNRDEFAAENRHRAVAQARPPDHDLRLDWRFPHRPRNAIASPGVTPAAPPLTGSR